MRSSRGSTLWLLVLPMLLESARPVLKMPATVETSQLAAGDMLSAHDVSSEVSSDASGAWLQLLAASTRNAGSKPVETEAVPRTSVKAVFEELMSRKRLTRTVKLESVGGQLQSGTMEDLKIVRAKVGKDTRMEVRGDGDMMAFVVTDIQVWTKANYNMRLTAMNIEESGRLTALLKGGLIELIIPMVGRGAGECKFSKDFEVTIIDSRSDNLLVRPFLNSAIRSDLLGLRTEMLAAMKPALCHALLLEPPTNREQAEPLASATSIYMIIGVLAALNVAFVCGVFGCGWHCALSSLWGKRDSLV